MNLDFLGAVVFIASCAYILKSLGSRTAVIFSALCTVLVLLEAVSGASGIFSSLASLMDGEYTDSIAVCLKVIGVGYIFGSAAEVCRLLSEEGVAKGVETVGRVEIILLVLPFVKEIIGMGESLL